MATVGIELLDHIIVTDTEYTSLRQRCELPVLAAGGVRLMQLREDSDAPEKPEEDPG